MKKLIFIPAILIFLYSGVLTLFVMVVSPINYIYDVQNDPYVLGHPIIAIANAIGLYGMFKTFKQPTKYYYLFSFIGVCIPIAIYIFFSFVSYK